MIQQNAPRNATGHDVPDTGRRDLLKLAGVSVAAIGAASFLNIPEAKAQTMSQDWVRTPGIKGATDRPVAPD